MGDYLKDFKESPAYREIDRLVPSDICSLLFYNLVPYIFTLANGGRFNWVRHYKDISFRKPINKDDFKRKGVNRLYPNEVLVRCPNPHTMVVAGVGLWPEDKIKIRILHCDNPCMNNHKPGDEIVMDKVDTGIDVLDFNRIFPETMSLCLAGEVPERNRESCKIDNEIIIKVSKIIFSCRYHKNKKEFKSHFLPDRFCYETFTALYPYILATMYNARISRNLKIRHPGKESYIILTMDKIILRKNRLVRGAINLLKKLFEAVFYPVDLLDYDLEINILENESEGCSLKKGRKYKVNLRDGNFLCPASSHTLYPYLLLTASGYKMKWGGDDIDNLLPCPDCAGTVYLVNKKGDSQVYR